MKNIKIILVLCFFLTIVACSSNKSLATMPPDQKWQRAEGFFEKKKWIKAIPFYEQLVFEKNSIYTADAQFKLGLCHMKKETYLDAIFEFQELLRLFPDHRLAADALYYIGESYVKISLKPEFTQTETDNAIDTFNRFIEKYPSDERVTAAYSYIAEMQLKLIEKGYLTGYIYYMQKDYPAAELYLNEILALENRNELEKKATYYTCLIHIDRKEKAQAEKYLNLLKEHFPNAKETKQAQSRYNRINSSFWRFFYFF